MGDKDQAGLVGAFAQRVECLEGGVHRGLNEARVVGIVTDPVDLDLSALRGVEQVLPVLPA